MTTTPSLEFTTVFDAARLGYRQVRIPALIRTGTGALIAFCEARRTPGDWSEIDLLARRSTDDGRTWSAPRLIARSEGPGKPVSNPVPIVGANGLLHLLYQRAYSRTYHATSRDDGLAWSAPRDITADAAAFRATYDWKVFAPGPGHGLRLDNGRLITAVWMCAPGDVAASADEPLPHRPSCAATFYSDDEGETWQCGDIVVPNNDTFVNPSETALAQLPDGRVYLNARTESPGRRRVVAVSPDGATRWTEPAFDDALYDPVCMASVTSATDPRTSRKVLLFCNPDSRFYQVRCIRENGVIRLSRDDGKTWAVARSIDAGPFSYSDLAASDDGTIYCLYEPRGRFDHEIYAQINLARFPLRWIEEAPLLTAEPGEKPPALAAAPCLAS